MSCDYVIELNKMPEGVTYSDYCDKFPEKGLYWDHLSWNIVEVPDLDANLYPNLYYIGNPLSVKPFQDCGEPSKEVHKEPSKEPQGIDPSVLLKAIAVTQNPELAFDKDC